MTGNALANRLNGGAGADTLTEGAGADSFVFTAPLGAGNIDRITDFTAIHDTIQLSAATFSGLTAGVLAASAFATNLTGLATDVLDRIIYETDTGNLFFDADGSAAGGRVQFATVSAGLAMTHLDFFVI